jgi:nucleotide-sensitive chloride channel 1A
MSVTTLSQAPLVDDCTPLSSHQEQTPQTFFGSKPVLYLQCPGAKLQAQREELVAQEEFAPLLGSDAPSEGEEVEVEVDVWVSSR